MSEKTKWIAFQNSSSKLDSWSSYKLQNSTSWSERTRYMTPLTTSNASVKYFVSSNEHSATVRSTASCSVLTTKSETCLRRVIVPKILPPLLICRSLHLKHQYLPMFRTSLLAVLWLARVLINISMSRDETLLSPTECLQLALPLHYGQAQRLLDMNGCVHGLEQSYTPDMATMRCQSAPNICPTYLFTDQSSYTLLNQESCSKWESYKFQPRCRSGKAACNLKKQNDHMNAHSLPKSLVKEH